MESVNHIVKHVTPYGYHYWLRIDVLNTLENIVAGRRNTLRVGLFVTCLVDAMRPSIGFSTLELLESAGCDVVVPKVQTCCGQPAWNSGDQPSTHKLAQKWLAEFEQFDYVVAPSGSCAGMTKIHYTEVFKNDPDFKDFPHDKDIYDGRLGRLRHAINQKQHWADMDAVALIKDRQVYPVRTHNAKGEINWKGSEADFWLKKDMEKKKHRKMKPEALRATRPCCQLFSKKRFSKRIDQLLEDEKDFGVTPGQDKSKAKKKHNPRKFGDPTKSLLLSDNAVAALNDGGDDESSNLTDSDASDSDGESDV